MIPHNVAYIISIALTLIGITLSLIVGASEQLELTPKVIAVIGIVGGVVQAARAFFPAANSAGQRWALNRRNMARPKPKE